jgi:hypothetical protein
MSAPVCCAITSRALRREQLTPPTLP